MTMTMTMTLQLGCSMIVGGARSLPTKSARGPIRGAGAAQQECNAGAACRLTPPPGSKVTGRVRINIITTLCNVLHIWPEYCDVGQAPYRHSPVGGSGPAPHSPDQLQDSLTKSLCNNFQFVRSSARSIQRWLWTLCSPYAAAVYLTNESPHLDFGRPTLLEPTGSHFKRRVPQRLSSLLATCPAKVHLRLLCASTQSLTRALRECCSAIPVARRIQSTQLSVSAFSSSLCLSLGSVQLLPVPSEL